MWSRKFWQDSAERSIKTFAQTAVSFLVIGTTGVLEVNWEQIVSVSGIAALASVLTSIASDRVGTKGTASLVKDEV